MGGDDLGSDDDNYLNYSAVVEDDDDNSSSDDDDDDMRPNKKKRNRSYDDDDHDDEDLPSPSNKKPKQTKSKPNTHNKTEALLLETSRNLLQSRREQQAQFLSTALNHYLKKKPLSADDDDDQQPHDDAASRLSTTYSITQLTHGLVQPPPTNDGHDSTFLQRLQSVANKKRLKKHGKNTKKQKNHNNSNSPSVLVICQSARRAVALLKECAPLGVAAAKLFPKQASVEQQARELRQAKLFPLAVGTPHRLLALLKMSEEEDPSTPPPLDLSQTQLVVLDAQPCPPKQYTVLTLPDTARDCAVLLQRYVLPQVTRRKDIKLAFL